MARLEACKAESSNFNQSKRESLVVHRQVGSYYVQFNKEGFLTRKARNVRQRSVHTLSLTVAPCCMLVARRWARTSQEEEHEELRNHVVVP